MKSGEPAADINNLIQKRRVYACLALASGILIFAITLIVSPSCLYTASPLARKVTPGGISIEMAGSIGLPEPGSGMVPFGGWIYLGFPLSDSFEIGVLPMLASSSTGISGLLAVPFRWDLSPLDSTIHWIIFTGPELLVVTFLGGYQMQPGLLAGTALAWTVSPGIDLYGALTFPAASLGARFALSPWMHLGVSATYSMMPEPGPFGSVTITLPP